MGLTSPRAEPRSDDVRAALERQFRELVDGGTHRIYVVMDGVRYEALPARLNAIGVSFRPLYRQVPGNEEKVLGGPWLVDPYLVSPVALQTQVEREDEDLSDEALEVKAAAMAAEMAAHVASGDETGGGALPSDIIDDPDRVAERLRQILDVIDDRPGAVFWITGRSVTAEMLSRHLRRINQMLVARKDAPRTVARPGGVAEARDYQRVIFRHADPNVMMQVVPALEPEQVARLLGPAALLFFAPEPEWGGGLKRIRHPGGAVSPAPGPFRLHIGEVEAIERRREIRACRKINHYLRAHAADHTGRLDEDELDRKVWSYRMEAKRYGIRSEAAHHRWAYLQLVSGGRITENENFDRFMHSPNAAVSADDRIGLLMRATIAHLRRAR